MTMTAAFNRTLFVTLDEIFYETKPDAACASAITRRLQKKGPSAITYAEFCAAIHQGYTFVGAFYAPCDNKWGEFQGQQVFALDFDNQADVRDIHGKRLKGEKIQLHEGDLGYLGPVDALDRCDELSLHPLCLYFTSSSVFPDVVKYRIVFVLDEPVTNENLAKELLGRLLRAFPEADQMCSNLNRLFYGSQKEMWECWHVWGAEDE